METAVRTGYRHIDTAAAYGNQQGRSAIPKSIGAFLGGLRDGKLRGVRAAEGSVLCPAHEFVPRTAEGTGEFVPLSDRGTVRAWTWVSSRSDDVLPHGWMGLCGGLCSSALAVSWPAGSEPSPDVTVCKSCDGRVVVVLLGWFRGWCRAIG